MEFLAEAAFGKYDSLDEAAKAWQERSDPLDLVQAKWDFTTDMGKAMLAESIEAWNQGKHSEAIGIFLGQSADVVLGGGIVGRGTRAARLGRAAEVIDTASDAQRVAGAAETAGRVIDGTADAARAADASAGATRGLRAGTAAETVRGTGKAASPTGIGLEGTRPAGSVDTIAPKTRGITVGDSPYLIRHDPRVPGRPDPRWSIDTSGFTEGVRTAGGGVRNAAEFWRRWLEARPETVSPNNRYLIEQLQRNPRGPSPRIDAQWVKHFPEHSQYLQLPYKSRVIFHHHVNQGPIAIPVPGVTHVGSGGPWH